MAKAKNEAVKEPEAPAAEVFAPAVIEVEDVQAAHNRALSHAPYIQPPTSPPLPCNSFKSILGRIVIFKLSKQNAVEINRRRTTPYLIAERIKLNSNSNTIWPPGAQAHIGNSVEAGDEFPAMVVYLEPEDGSPNLQVFLDGSDVYWAQSVEEGDSEGQWHWPVRG